MHGLTARLCCFLLLNEEEAEQALRGDLSAVDPDAVAGRVDLGRDDVVRILQSRDALEAHRLDLNRTSHAQWLMVPGIAPQRLRAVMEGRPYFTLDEAQSVSGLDDETLGSYFAPPTYGLEDGPTGSVSYLRPVPGRYVLAPRSDFESAELLASTGFIEARQVRRPRARLVVASDEESARGPGALKAAFGGRVLPVLRDEDGFDRLLVPGSLEVWFSVGTAPSRARAIFEQAGLSVTLSRPTVGFYQGRLREPPGDLDYARAVLEKVSEVQELPEVRFAEPDQVDEDDFGPQRERSLPDFESALAGVRHWNLDLIDAPGAHAIATGSSDVTMIFIDSGVRTDHPDVEGSLRSDWRDIDLNFDPAEPPEATSPLEMAVSHGTKVASVAGGRAPAANVGVRGIAPGCPVLPFKISGAPLAQSYGLRAAAILEAVRHVPMGERAVINLSWATNGEHVGIREALLEASERGLAIVTSAGNYSAFEPQEPDRPHYPSRYAPGPGDSADEFAARRKIRRVVSVAAVDATKRKATYSYFGPRAVTISAPGGEAGESGVGIYVASTPASYAYDAGTSFAAPHITGALALLMSVDPIMTSDVAIDIVRETATNLDNANPSHAGMLGAGLLNLRAAIERAMGSPTSALSGPLVAPATMSASTPSTGLNINAATVEALSGVPGLGTWSASRIVQSRTQEGPFPDLWSLERTGAIDRWGISQIESLIFAGPNSNATSTGEPFPTEFSSGLVIAAIDERRLNLNRAHLEEIAALPYIGQWSASVIVAWRDAHGPFTSVTDLLCTGAVDAWALELIEPLVRAP